MYYLGNCEMQNMTGTITDNDKKYGEWQYKVDFAKKEVI